MVLVRRLGLACAALALVACASSRGELAIPDADTERFFDEVYPILLADCGYPACHGNSARPLAVFGPGRVRLDSSTDITAPMTAEELAISYTRARSMLISPDGSRRSPLLRKPLAIGSGGADHGGDDPWGNAIFSSKRDPRYEALFFWAIGEGAR